MHSTEKNCVIVDFDATAKSLRLAICEGRTDIIFFDQLIDVDVRYDTSIFKRIILLIRLLLKTQQSFSKCKIVSFGAQTNIILAFLTCFFPHADFIPTINGLGRWVRADQKKTVVLTIYLWLLKTCSSFVIVQNTRDHSWLNKKQSIVIPGSGFPSGLLVGRKQNFPKDVPRFGFVGRFENRKGAFTFLELSQKFPQSDFIVFSNLKTENIRKLSSDFDNVIFHDFVDQSEIYKKIDVLVFPSNYGEGIARVVIEALASQVDVISTTIPGNTDLVSQFGFQLFLLEPQATIIEYEKFIRDYYFNEDAEKIKAQRTLNQTKCQLISTSEIVKKYQSVIDGSKGEDIMDQKPTNCIR